MKSNENNRENYHINSITHLRIDTLDTKLIHELRAIKHDVPIEGTVVWDKDNGFNSIINSTKIFHWLLFQGKSYQRQGIFTEQ